MGLTCANLCLRWIELAKRHYGRAVLSAEVEPDRLEPVVQRVLLLLVSREASYEQRFCSRP